MSEKLKAWAVVNEYGVLVGLHADEKSAIAEARERLSVDLPHDWIAKDRVVKELVEKEPEQKLVLNEDQYKELIKLNDITPRYNVYGALSMALESIDCVNLRKVVGADDNIAQARFAHLWTQLESTDIDDLVEVIKPKKYIIVSKADGTKYYLQVSENHIVPIYASSRSLATKFESIREAEDWLNPKMKIVEDERE